MPDPTDLTRVLIDDLLNIDEDAWTEGTLDEVALRLYRLQSLGRICEHLAAACEQTVIDSMETDSMTVTGLGKVTRVEKTSSAWNGEHASARLRDDLTQAVATNIATDIATGDIDPVKRNIARAAMNLAFEAIPSFSSLNKPGRERLGLHIGDYRTYATSYKIAIDADKEGT